VKSQNQALNRVQPGPPLNPGRRGTMTHDYERNGTTTRLPPSTSSKARSSAAARRARAPAASLYLVPPTFSLTDANEFQPEFVAFIARMNAVFAEWRQTTATTLRELKIGFHPKEIVAAVAEDLFAHYAGKPLIDNYDVYQHLMDYWADVMQDDCYLIAADGWKAETSRIIEKDKKGKEKDKGWICDLVPKARIVARYFAKEQEDIDKLAVELESDNARMTELEEEHGGEDGLFSELEKVNKANVLARLKEMKGDKEAKDEVAVLDEWLRLAGDETELKKALKDTEAVLDAKAYAKYRKLTASEIKTLVVDDKWLATLDTAIHAEMDRISQGLTQRVKELAERYETPMPRAVFKTFVADLN
jgi:type I restriction enzyme M protein